MLFDFGVSELRLKVTESRGFFVIIGHLLKILYVKYVYNMEGAMQIPNCKAWLMLSKSPMMYSVRGVLRLLCWFKWSKLGVKCVANLGDLVRL
jgi:hypothetical protein